MKKILLSLATIAIVGIAATGLTVSFYGDTETSTGNTFTAGSIELKIDSRSHYNNMVCTDMGEADPRYQWQPEVGFNPGPEDYPQPGDACDGTWAETDLQDGAQKFFNFSDLKPGDKGEDTISLHVYDNDAWGQFEFTPTRDADNTCTEPETVAEDSNHNDTICDPENDGEIDENLYWTAWLDWGSLPGFQCGEQGPNNAECDADRTEGDNIHQEGEPYIWNNTLIGETGPFNLRDLLSSVWSQDCSSAAANGHDDYGECHGIAEDGRLVGSTTYYFGLAWDFPLSTGNEISTDEYTADMIFRVEQMRNNPTPFQD